MSFTTLVSVTAQVAADVQRQLTEGTLRVDGIVLRDMEGKIRYIVRNLESLTTDDPSQLADLEALQLLRRALTTQQIFQAVSVAQNLMTAASLRQIQSRLDALDTRLRDIDKRLTSVKTATSLILAGMRGGAVNRLKAAKSAAVAALRKGDSTALIGATQAADHSARDVLEQAKHLVRYEEDGLPVALRVPREFSDLVSSVADAMEAASAMWVAQQNQDLATDLLKEAVRDLEDMRRQLNRCYEDPELMLRRTNLDAALDPLLMAAGATLREALHRCLGRQAFVEFGIIGPDPKRHEFEMSVIQPQLGVQPEIVAVVAGP